jgi:hypothetical protein
MTGFDWFGWAFTIGLWAVLFVDDAPRSIRRAAAVRRARRGRQ